MAEPEVAPLPSLPLVGRASELGRIHALFERARSGNGGMLVLTGPDGVGKSSLAAAALEEASKTGFVTALGRTFPIERGVPYALFADLLHPLLETLSPDGIATLTRGGPEFGLILPRLLPGEEPGSAPPAEGIPDLRNRLLWNFPAFLERLRKDRPLLLVLEDLQWADPSSLELLHFLARQEPSAFVLLCTLNDSRPGQADGLQEALHSLKRLGRASLLPVGPLAADDVRDLLSRGFGVDPEVARGASERLHHWTGGNPLFLHALLESLVASGRLGLSAGRWVGWGMEDLPPPGSIRSLVLEEARGLEPPERELADLAAVAGLRPWFPLLVEASTLSEDELLEALDVLERRRILESRTEGGELLVPFVHPMVREVLYQEVGTARTRRLHAELAHALERIHGDRALEHADELAHHFSRSGRTGDAARALRYEVVAGRRALAGHAYGEAAAYLQDALRRMDQLPREQEDPEARIRLLLDLARARQRMGHFDDARSLLEEARERAGAEASGARLSRIDRRLGFSAFWSGRLDEALSHWMRGLEEARAAGDRAQEARCRLARSAGLLETGRPEDALEEAREALRLAEHDGATALRARAHRTLMALHIWIGPPSTAREHGRAALELARQMGNPMALFAAHWGMATAEGLARNVADIREHIREATRIAKELDSPVLRLRIAEVALEEAAGTGDWNRGIDLAEEAIRMARELDQPLILPRLLVWAGRLHLGRGDLDRARELIDETWERAGRGEEGGAPDIHITIIAHFGRAALRLAEGNPGEALRAAEAGLDLVDRTGYTAWGIHLLLPVWAEAALHVGDTGRAREASRRLREAAERFEHAIAPVWADACDGLVAWLEGDIAAASGQMRRAAERLEELGHLPDAVRLRRQLAGRLADLGDREAALEELRRVHEALLRLGAGPELGKARIQFREVGARPPSKPSSAGPHGLTEREVEIAGLVGERRSNKAIGKALGISPRTVSTHLSNIFRKLEIDSRQRLGDMVREGDLD